MKMSFLSRQGAINNQIIHMDICQTEALGILKNQLKWLHDMVKSTDRLMEDLLSKEIPF